MQISSDILDFCVLSCLCKEDLYGYILTQKVQEKIKISESTLYPVLRRLQKKEFLETYDSSFQGRNRRYYKITEMGKEELIKFIDEWKTLKNEIDLFIEEAGLND
ncbi:PadR family transcriptional regulator [Streptobacillus felis]|uniref:PadR family transcriptional regulator n=1 Tax=Streptobacillus felis TaxID=1384509 RepID=A0A7Z0PF13_9FUSO|nr:PadR family transcriptional regulator [Streptobacillus felis]NYV27987.1 PadR family transcriptional regulator [Streptobacillus felis]